MICGLCAFEQPFSNKPCRMCGALLGPKKGTAHWEGGKGSRNQQTMSKKDSKKYRGLTKNDGANKGSRRG